MIGEERDPGTTTLAARPPESRDPVSADRRSLPQRALGVALLAAAVFVTAAATAPLAIWQKALVSVGVAVAFWALAAPVLAAMLRARPPRPHQPPALDLAEQELPERIAARLDAPMAVLGIIFLLLVVAEGVVNVDSFETPFQVASWVIWAAFASEFLIRLWAAPSRRRYLRRNWWQIVFLVVPFLRFLRLLRVFRVTRAGRVLSSAVRSVRSATRTLTGRLGWLLAVHVIVVLAASQLVFEFGGMPSYAEALAVTAMSAVAGEPTGGTTAFARVMDILLAMYAAVMFAALAGVLAAYFLDRLREQRDARSIAAGERAPR